MALCFKSLLCSLCFDGFADCMFHGSHLPLGPGFLKSIAIESSTSLRTYFPLTISLFDMQMTVSEWFFMSSTGAGFVHRSRRLEYMCSEYSAMDLHQFILSDICPFCTVRIDRLALMQCEFHCLPLPVYIPLNVPLDVSAETAMMMNTGGVC